MLATSREPLNLRAEQRYPVSPLAGFDAAALFARRARARDPAFALHDDSAAAVADICRRVDGLPLAIELAAARCGLLAPAEIAERLDTALGPLGTGPRDAPARQQTLHATIEWSHELLTDEEQDCFARFAVFAGGATVEAAEAITGADAGLDVLDRLVAKSLLVRRRRPGGETRLAMLATIRAFAGERFAAAADADAVRGRHCRYFLALAERHGSSRALWGRDRKQHLARLDADIDNLEAALGWALDQPRGDSGLALCAALGEYWLMRQRYRDATDWLERALRSPGAVAHPALHAQLLCKKSWAIWPLGRGDEAAADTAEAEAIARDLSDPLLLWQALQARAACEADRGRLEVADAMRMKRFDRHTSPAMTGPSPWRRSPRRWPRTARPRLRERADLAASLLEGVGNVYHLAGLLASAAYGALVYGDDRHAGEYIRRAIPITRELDNPHMWMLLSGNAGLTALLNGDVDAAREHFTEELRASRVPVALPFASEALRGLAALAAAGDDLDRAARLVGAAGAHRGRDPHDAIDTRLDETFFEPARGRHGPDVWDASVRAGSLLSFEDAIAYALDAANA